MPLPFVAALVSAVLPSLIGTAAEKILGDEHPLGDAAKNAALAVAEEVTGLKITSRQAAESAASRISEDPDAAADFQRILNDRLSTMLNAENERIRLQLADAQNARGQTIALAQTGSVIAWGSPVVSVLVVAGYFTVMWRLFGADADAPPNVFALLNMLFGALTIGFGQVCNYWLGSSAGSKAKDEALRLK